MIIKYFTRLFNKGIFNKLVFSYIIIILTPLLLISLLSYNKIVDLSKNNYLNQNIQVLKSIDLNISAYFDDYRQLTYNTLLSGDIQSIVNSNQSEIEAQLINQSTFNRFALNLIGDRMDVEGVFLVCDDKYIYNNGSSNNSINQSYDLTKESWYRQIKQSRGEFVLLGSHKQKYKYGTVNGHVITAARKIRNINTGESKGIFFIEIKTDILDNKTDIFNSSSQNIIIVDSNNKIVYDRKKENIENNFSTAYPNLYIPMSKDTIYTHDNGNSYTISIYNKSTGWHLVETVSVDQMLRDIRNITNTILITAVICFILFLLFSIYISRSIANPIKSLNNSMKIVQKGNFSHMANVNCGGEVQSLADSFNTMIREIQKLLNTVYESRIRKIESEFKALQAQINPHFLYNTLESINCLAEINGDKEVSSMIRGLARMFRYSIGDEKALVPLEQELNHVKDYILLQAVRYDDSLNIEYLIPQELLQVKVLKMLLQPLVENSIKYGFEGISEKGRIKIYAYRKEDSLFVCVWNMGIPIDNEKLNEIKNLLNRNANELLELDSRSHSIGIYNIHARVRLKFGDEYGLNIESSKDEGTLVQIKLPFTA